jgi:hypothetical protein
MTDTPKVRFNNSILAPAANATKAAAPEIDGATDKTVVSLEKEAAAKAPEPAAAAAAAAPKAAALMQK